MRRIKNTIIKKIIKRRINYPCTSCKKDIVIGEEYISEIYNDGFLKKGVGAYHLKCWDKLNKIK